VTRHAQVDVVAERMVDDGVLGLGMATCVLCGTYIATLMRLPLTDSATWRIHLEEGLVMRPTPEPVTGLPRYGVAPRGGTARRHSDPFENPRAGIVGRIPHTDRPDDIVMTDAYARALFRKRAELKRGLGVGGPIWVHCPKCNAGQRLDPPSGTAHNR
jgi:hypothetical protein